MIRFALSKFRLRSSLLAVSVAALGIVGFADAGTASASADQTAAAPAVNCPAGSGAWVGLHNANAVDCISGVGTLTRNQIIISEPFTSMTIHVHNRVWFHQNPDGSGWADCFSTSNPPRSFTLSGRDRTPGNIQISSNTAPC